MLRVDAAAPGPGLTLADAAAGARRARARGGAGRARAVRGARARGDGRRRPADRPARRVGRASAAPGRTPATDGRVGRGRRVTSARRMPQRMRADPGMPPSQLHRRRRSSAAALVLARCGGTAEVDRARQVTPENVPFTGCDKVACSDTIDGAPYEILLPTTWNGTLLHLLPRLPLGAARAARTSSRCPPRPSRHPDGRAATPASPTPCSTQGYALAGLGVQDATAGRSPTASRPRRTCTSSSPTTSASPTAPSCGATRSAGLITQTIAEKHPEWVDGAHRCAARWPASCPTSNLALDVSYAMKTLLYPEMKLTGFTRTRRR